MAVTFVRRRFTHGLCEAYHHSPRGFRKVQVIDGEISNAVIGRFSATETLDIGMDLGAVVSHAYHDEAPFAFTGQIKEVAIEISPTQPLIQK